MTERRGDGGVVRWVEVVCTHAGQGLDAAPETVHRHYAGDDPGEKLAGVRLSGVRGVRRGRLVDDAGEYRRHRHEDDTYSHRSLYCDVCGLTERVRDDRLTRALARVGEEGESMADTRGIVRVPLSAVRGIVSAID